MPAAEVSMRDADSVDLLCEEHRNPFEKALRRILNTELAEHTYAEILDGLPTNDSYRDLYYPREGHPSLQHLKLCPGVRERAREFRSSFDITALKFRSSVSLILKNLNHIGITATDFFIRSCYPHFNKRYPALAHSTYVSLNF